MLQRILASGQGARLDRVIRRSATQQIAGRLLSKQPPDPRTQHGAGLQPPDAASGFSDRPLVKAARAVRAGRSGTLPAAVSHPQERADGERELVNWPTSIGIAIGGAVAAIALILVFTYLVDWIGDFWSQVVYFAAIFVVVLELARRDRRRDEED